jgi:hypothetical protein
MWGTEYWPTTEENLVGLATVSQESTSEAVAIESPHRWALGTDCVEVSVYKLEDNTETLERRRSHPTNRGPLTQGRQTQRGWREAPKLRLCLQPGEGPRKGTRNYPGRQGFARPFPLLLPVASLHMFLVFVLWV